MFLRETRRTNRDGSVVSYLQLAHNERHPVSGNPVAKVIHSFGRADQVDRAALARLVSSISRFLTPEQAVTATTARRIRATTVATAHATPTADASGWPNPRTAGSRMSLASVSSACVVCTGCKPSGNSSAWR